jgi:DNA-directed RNA polymerase specialized sigma24 family protein
MSARMDQEIEQLEAIVERRLDLCQESWHGIRCTLPASHEPEESHRFPVIERAELQELIANVFGLPQGCREVFLLCDIQGLTVTKAAAIIGIGASEARVRLIWARREMHNRLRTAV